MRVGLVGCGSISDTHARAVRAIPGAEIVAFCGRSEEKSQRLASLYGGAAYRDLESFLRHRPMEVVAIGSPSALHAEQGIEAARHGLHVLVEKPIDITTEQVDRLIAATDEAGVRLAVFFQDRLEPDILALKQLVACGTLGRPVLASGRVKWYRTPEYYSGSRWRGTWAGDGGGALMNQGIHTVDLLLSLLGPIARVSAAVATRLHRIEVEDTAVAALEFANGAIGTLEAATSAYPGFARRVEVTGTEGTAILEQSRLVSVEVRTPAAAKAWQPAGDARKHESATSPVVSDAAGHRRIFEDFFRAIETGCAPCCDGREGRRSVAVIQAIYASAQEGKAVAVAGSR